MNFFSSHYPTILLLLAAVIIRYIISRSCFNRRGIGGQQLFPSYERAVLTTFLEWLFRWLANIAILIALLRMLIR